MAHSLDGKYLVTTTASHQSSLQKKSDGETTIVNGRTERFDDANCKWTSSFEILNEHEVKMTSVADPAKAHIDFFLTAPDGSPTHDITTYEAILKLSRKDTRVQISGQIQYGADTIFLTMRSI